MKKHEKRLNLSMQFFAGETGEAAEKPSEQAGAENGGGDPKESPANTLY